MSATWTWRAGIALALALSLAIPAFAGKGGGNGKPGGGGDPPSDPRVLFTTEGAIHVMNDDGTNQTRVLDTGEAYVLHADWSPDATEIVFESRMNGEGIYVMDADGGNVRMLTTMGNFTWAHPVWSPVPAPDGRYKVAYIDKVATDVRAVFCVNTDGTGHQQLTVPVAGRTGHWNVSWSPDATRIAVVADTTGDLPPDDVLVCDLRAASTGGLEVAATRNLMSESDNPGGSINAADHVRERIAWSKTGNRIAVSARLPGGTDEIYLIDVTASTSPDYLTTGYNPSWSSDDARIVFERDGSGRARRDLLVVDADGTSESMLVQGSRRSSPHAPAWMR